MKTHGNRTVRHLKPGTYRVLPRTLTRPDGAWKATARPKKVTVTKRKGARVRIVYAAPPQPPVPPVDTTDLPEKPFPATSAPSSIALVSRTPAGAAGNKQSLGPTWSPDGQYLAFSSCATNLNGTVDGWCYIYKAHQPDGAVSRVPNTRMDDIYNWGGEPAWSSDSKQIAFTTTIKLVIGDTDTNKDVYVVSATGTNPQRVSQTQAGANMTGSPAAAHDPQWSPGNTKVLFRSTATNLAAGSGDLYIKTLVGGSLSRTGTGERSEGARWSADGRIAFTAGSETFNPATYLYDRNYDVFTATDTGASVTAATTDHGVWGPPTWSPTGALAYATSAALVPTDTNEAADVYTTTGQRVSTGSTGEQSLWAANDPVWSPDGQKVAFVSSGTGPSTLLVKNLVTGAVTQLADPTHGTVCGGYEFDEESGETYCASSVYYEAKAPAWSPDSTRVAFVSTYPDLVAGDTNGAWDVFVATL
ncbi:MAG: hypothetical protein MUF33_10580 [Candidatus Nanopelagicales bacterium]|nr:hypothetical protein [Candidatus Nanopelagicales bacterium]